MLVVGMCTAACACGPVPAQFADGTAAAPTRAANAGHPVVITREEIASAHAPSVWTYLRNNVRKYAFVEDRYGNAVTIRSRRGQSSLLLPAADEPVVIVDGARLIAFDVLQQMPTDAVETIELFGALQGTAIAGTNAGSGVIYIHTVAASSP